MKKEVTFEVAIERILSHEGGYVNHPNDPGGETKWGIAKRSYPNEDIKNMTRERAKELYEQDFWNPVCKLIPDGAMRFQLLDAAVNHGMGNAVRFLQRAIGVADDGWFGAASTKAYLEMEQVDVHLLFVAERLEFWTKLKTFDSFGRGWTRRGAQNLRYIAQDN